MRNLIGATAVAVSVGIIGAFVVRDVEAAQTKAAKPAKAPVAQKANAPEPKKKPVPKKVDFGKFEDY